MLYTIFESVFSLKNVGLERCIYVLECSCGRNDAVKVLVGQHHSTVDKVAGDGHKLVIVARLEVGPSEVVILSLGGISGKYIAQHVLLAGEILEILVEPNGPVARCRNLVAFKVKELIGRHVVRQIEIVIVSLKHRREDNAVEHDIILAYEVYQTRFRIFPPRFPCIGI